MTLFCPRVKQAEAMSNGKPSKSNLTLSSSNPISKKTKRGRRTRRRGISRGPDGILAGYGSSITSVFSSRSTSDGQIVRGFDLLPNFTLGSNISFYLTANPAAWNGTRIAAIASGYQSYRPLSVRVHYRPQTGSTSTVAVFIGTLWQTNYITARSAVEPSLLTSPGGVYTPAWQSCITNIHCGNYLPQRMFPTRDPHMTTVPFAFIVRATDGGSNDVSTSMPGRLFVEYTYEFRNAIGSGTGFSPSVVNTYEITKGVYKLGSTAEPPPVRGVLVDFDSHYLPDLPLGGLVSWTQGETASDMSVPYRLSINGSDAANYSGTLYVYSDNGSP